MLTVVAGVVTLLLNNALYSQSAFIFIVSLESM